MIEPTRRMVLVAAMGVGMAANKETLAWDFGFPSIDEGRLDFATFKGRVLLVTNTASFCGYTYQYEGLEKLHKAGSPRGLTVIGVPSQDFNQEFRRQRDGEDVLRGDVRRGVPDGGDRACARRRCGAVLCLGARAEALGAELEFQQGADRPRWTYRGDVRFRR